MSLGATGQLPSILGRSIMNNERINNANAIIRAPAPWIVLIAMSHLEERFAQSTAMRSTLAIFTDGRIGASPVIGPKYCKRRLPIISVDYSRSVVERGSLISMKPHQTKTCEESRFHGDDILDRGTETFWGAF